MAQVRHACGAVAALVAACVLGAGCFSSGDFEGRGQGGGGGGTGGAGGQPDLCEPACSQAAAAGCTNPRLSCVSGCQRDYMLAPACADKLNAMFACEATATFGCDATGAPEAMGCATLTDAAVSCIAPTVVCAPNASDTACLACERRDCCSQLIACSMAADCLDLLRCVVGCASGDNACLTNCGQIHPSGAALLVQVDQCVQSSCAAECASSAGTGGAGP